MSKFLSSMYETLIQIIFQKYRQSKTKLPKTRQKKKEKKEGKKEGMEGGSLVSLFHAPCIKQSQIF